MMQDMFHRTPVAGGARRLDHQSVQRRRPVPVGVGLRLHRTTQHLPRLLRHAVLFVSADSRAWPRRRTGSSSRSRCSSSSRCTAAASRRYRRFWRTSSGPRTWARSTARCSPRGARPRWPGPVIITELSNRAKAALPAGADRIHIYDTPLQVLAGLLAVGFVLTLIVRPLRPAARVAAGAEMRTREAL